jgi:ACS family glucarate transporter-like MFS transporter
MDRVCIPAAKGWMQKDISDLDDQMMDYIFGIAAIGYALSQLPPGWFSDRSSPQHELTMVMIILIPFAAATRTVFTTISMLIVPFLDDVGMSISSPNVT